MAKHRAPRKPYTFTTLLKGQWRAFLHAWDEIAFTWYWRSTEEKKDDRG